MGGYVSVKYLALAEGTLRAVFGPSGAAEASDPVFIYAGLGDVIPNRIGQAGVRDAAWTTLALWNHRKLTVCHWRTRYGPAVHFTPLRNTQTETYFNPIQRTKSIFSQSRSVRLLAHKLHTSALTCCKSQLVCCAH